MKAWKAFIRSAAGLTVLVAAVIGAGFSAGGASATTCCLPPPPPSGGKTQPPPVVIGGAGIEQGTENEGDQWITKQYTELLGRTPTVSEWQSAESQVLGVKLLETNQAALDKSIVHTSEFGGLGYSNTEKAVVLYRAILDRDPKTQAEVTNTANLIAGAGGIDAAIDDLYNGPNTSAEAQEVNGEASQAGPYYWGSSFHHFDPNSTTAYSHISSGHFAGGTAAQLQAALNATPSGGTLYLDEGAVVTADSPITVPGNVTLSTFGVTNRNAYARLGRVIRTAKFTSPLVTLQGSARLNYVWLDGNRPAFMVAPAINPLWYDWDNKYPLDSAGCGATGGTSYPGPTIRDCMKNISIVGGSAQVTNSRVQDPLGSTNMKAATGVSGVTISGNLITSYATSHFLGETSNSADSGLWSDGITFDGASSTISNNQIVDATDVAIVLFGSPASGTNNNVFGNTDVQAGNSAYGGFVFDPFKCATPTSCQTFDFAGSSIHDNTLWSGWYAHYVVALSVGTRAWFGLNTGPAGKKSSGNLANHASMVNNQVPSGVKIRTGIGVGVDGAVNSTATGNNLNRTVSIFSSAFVGWAGGPCTNPGNTPGVITNDNADSTGNTVSDPTGATVTNMALHTTSCADVGGMTKKESVAIY